MSRTAATPAATTRRTGWRRPSAPTRAPRRNRDPDPRRHRMETVYTPAAPERAAIAALAGATLLEFGANWCGHCRATQAPLAQAYAGHPGVRHHKIEDGPGRALGRSYQVKLWPTLVFLR